MDKKHFFDGIMLVSDMDGTLITNQFKMPERNIAAINRFVENGGRFALATGRVAASAVKHLNRININTPSILSNGASIYDFASHKILWCAQLPLGSEIMLAQILKQFPDVGAEVYRNEEIYIINTTELTDKHIVNEGFKFTVTDLENVPHGWQKILLAAENSRLREVDDYVSHLNHDGFYFVFSNSFYFEFLSDGVSKGTALHRLADMLKIEHRKTVAIGDYFNDLELISMAGFGATVVGAPKELCEAASFVAGPCEDGAVADLIEYIEKTSNLFDKIDYHRICADGLNLRTIKGESFQPVL